MTMTLATQHIQHPQAPYLTDIVTRQQEHLAAHPQCDVIAWVRSGDHAAMVRCPDEARIEQIGPGWRRNVCGICDGSALHAVSDVTTRALGREA